MIDAKPTNPKDAIGSGKLPMSLVPESAIALESLAFLEGALKYGRFNWRVAGVRASIYADALRRHYSDWWNGEDCDPVTKVPHLASVRACAGILIDAGVCGKLTDDRPPAADVGGLIRSLEAEVARLKKMYAEHDPKQYTIADSANNPVPAVAMPSADAQDEAEEALRIAVDTMNSIAADGDALNTEYVAPLDRAIRVGEAALARTITPTVEVVDQAAVEGRRRSPRKRYPYRTREERASDPPVPIPPATFTVTCEPASEQL